MLNRILAALVAAVLLLAGCSDTPSAPRPLLSDEQRAAMAAADATATAQVPPTAAALATPTPEPTPDPILAEAEAVALEFQELGYALLDSPRDFDLTRLIELEAPGSRLDGYALGTAAWLLEENFYLDSDEVATELIGSRYESEDVAVVDFCQQTGATWRDLDTDEVSWTTHPDPAVVSYKVSIATMQVLDLLEQLDQPCTFMVEQ